MPSDWPIPQVANDALVAGRIPGADASWQETERFALTFNAYDFCTVDGVPADIANRARERWSADGELPPTISGLRTCLFFEQRRWRHFAENPEGDDLRYIRALLEQIREMVRSRDASELPVSCRRCEAFGLRFERRMYPEDFIEGSPDARVWIIGLNPAGDSGAQTADESNRYFDSAVHSYFHDFGKVLPEIYASLGKPGGTAHTDLVKCWSSSFPPAGCTGKAADSLVRNCITYLEMQIRAKHPDVLICNGAAVSRWVKEFLPPDREQELMTSYTATLDGVPIAVVLTGFVGRIDDYSKARLGREIRSILERRGPNQRIQQTRQALD